MADEEDFTVVWAPLASMIREVGESVARASVELNLAQVALAKKHREEMMELGLTPTFYNMQTIEAELKLSLALTEVKSEHSTDEERSRWHGTSSNATSESQQTTSKEGSSTLRMVFAPAPPPQGWEEFE